MIYTDWRQEQLLHERLAELDSVRRRRRRIAAIQLTLGAALIATAWMSTIYLVLPRGVVCGAELVGTALVLFGTFRYFMMRPAAMRLVWPMVRKPAR